MKQSLWQRYRERVHKHCIRSVEEPGDLQYWQDYLFASSMTWLVPLSLIALIPGIYVSKVAGSPILFWVDLMVLPYFWILLLVPGITVRIRKLLSVGGIYLIAVIMLLELSSFGPGLLYLLAVNMLTVLILGRFWGMVSVALNLLISVGVTLFIYLGLFDFLRIHEYNMTTWIGVSSNLVFLSLLSVVMIPVLFDGLQATIMKQRVLERELIEANHELSSFATVASHDMKEPLRMIHSFMQLLEKRYGSLLEDRGKQYIEFAKDGSRRMMDLIDDLLEYSRIGRKYVRFDDVDLTRILEGSRALYRAELESLEGRVDVGPLPTVRAVPVAMRLVMQNLISNALKYHRKGVPLRIEVTSHQREGRWVVEVRDNGIGIDKGHHDEIFQMFRRLHSRDEIAGSGLGLAICQKIMEQHGGSIEVSSSPGEGAIFRLVFSDRDISDTSADPEKRGGF
ncbi:MAG: sensor histidine kinase [Bacteroidota bacterium]